MKDYNMYLPTGSIVRHISYQELNSHTPYYENSILIHYKNLNVPSDISPYRITKIVIEHGEEWDGMKVISYKDSDFE